MAASAEVRGPIILTVAGAVANPSRGALDPDMDKFSDYLGAEFDRAAVFDHAALAALGMESLRADFPMGGDEHLFEGPRLADVLQAAGSEGERISLMALDGFLVELNIAEATAKGAILALKRDGQWLGIGDYGPAHLVFPRAERADLADMNDDSWIWSVFLITVH